MSGPRPPLAELLDLAAHPEGGWFRQTWRAATTLTPPGYPGERATATAIHFVLGAGEESMWHRVRSDELWFWHRGTSLHLVLGGADEEPEEGALPLVLGPRVEEGQVLQALVPGGVWQRAWPVPDGEVLVSCVVSPGFEFADFGTWPPAP